MTNDLTDGVGTIRLNGDEIVSRCTLGEDPLRGPRLQREKGGPTFRRIRIGGK